MKIIEAMKKIKDLMRKAEDLKEKVRKYSVISSIETPEYEDQKTQVSEWCQAYSDVIKEILKLRVAIQKTNIATKVSIELGEKHVEKTIAEWIHRRRDLAELELSLWQSIGDKGIKEGIANSPAGNPIEVKIIRYYDPKERDGKKAVYAEEPRLIDSKLEVVNAITDLIED